MARWFDVTVITQTRNRPGIEREMAKGIPGDRTLKFEYHQLPQAIYRLKSRFDPLTWPYYIVWQWTMMGLAARLHRNMPFALVHHVTFVSFRVPIWLKSLGIPVVFGPVGGAERAPLRLLARGFGPVVFCKEIIRNVTTAICARTLRWFPPLHRDRGLCLAATPGMEAIFKGAGFPARLFPAIGVDAGPQAPPAAADAGGGLRVLFVGRFHPLKGVRLLLNAFAKADVPGSSLTLVGGGPDEAKLRRHAVELGIDERVEWVGRVPHEELPGYYRRHHLLMAPSLYESGGLAALEAMAEGLPAIVLDVGGHSVSVGDGCGVKVPAGGGVNRVVAQLAAAIRGYARDPGLLARHGGAARRRVLELYDWERKAEVMRSIYLEWISGSQPADCP